MHKCFKNVILLLSNDALNCPKVTAQTFILQIKEVLSNFQTILKEMDHGFHKNIKQQLFFNIDN